VLPVDAITESMFVASGCAYPIDHSYASVRERSSYCALCTENLNGTSLAPSLSPIGTILPANESFAPIPDQAELFRAVDAYLENGSSSYAALKYGYPICQWNVAQISNFSSTFDIARNPKAWTFNERIGRWNTSAATSMSYMFSGLSRFHQDISRWSTGKVTNMSGMCTSSLSSHQDLMTPSMMQLTTSYSFFASHGCRSV
jgi:surface protein